MGEFRFWRGKREGYNEGTFQPRGLVRLENSRNTQNSLMMPMKFKITPPNGRLGGWVPSADVTAGLINVFRIIDSWAVAETFKNGDVN